MVVFLTLSILFTVGLSVCDFAMLGCSIAFMVSVSQLLQNSVGIIKKTTRLKKITSWSNFCNNISLGT